MTRFVNLLRVKDGILGLQAWRDQVDSQGAMHLSHLLAAKRGGVKKTEWVKYGEQQDKEFCDLVLLVRPGTEPYYDPLDDSFRISSHYHSNIATARKNTFANRWRAAEYRDSGGQEEWRFSKDYLAIIKEKVLSKGGVVSRIPLYDLLAWVYRKRALPADITLAKLRNIFRSEYNISDDEFGAMFSEANTDGSAVSPAGFFVSQAPTETLLLELVNDVRGFDLAEALIEAALIEGGSPVKADDIAGMVSKGRTQLILQGPPGTGKTYLSKLATRVILGLKPSADKEFEELFVDPATEEWTKKQIERAANGGGWSLIQFHPSYTYEDFVRGIYADLVGDTPTFRVRDRTFLRLCDLARHTKRPVVLIVDEINRADLSKVLGELVYALEYRDEPVALQYGKGGEISRVPKNLVFIGTMNTADHSIAHIDYAIRRRFDFIDVTADRSVIDAAHADPQLKKNALAIFDAIAGLLARSPDQAVGHSYFLGKNAREVATSVVFQVLPLLADYRRQGVLEEGDRILLPKWPGETGLPIRFERPFELVDQLVGWLEQDNGAAA